MDISGILPGKVSRPPEQDQSTHRDLFADTTESTATPGAHWAPNASGVPPVDSGTHSTKVLWSTNLTPSVCNQTPDVIRPAWPGRGRRPAAPQGPVSPQNGTDQPGQGLRRAARPGASRRQREQFDAMALSPFQPPPAHRYALGELDSTGPHRVHDRAASRNHAAGGAPPSGTRSRKRSKAARFREPSQPQWLSVHPDTDISPEPRTHHNAPGPTPRTGRHCPENRRSKIER